MTLAASLAALAAITVVAAGAGTVGYRAADREAAARAAYPPSGRMLDVDGTQVHAWVSGSGPDVVLIHGAGGSLRDFTYALAPALAPRHRVIAFDRPGHGHTGHPDGKHAGIWGAIGESPQVQARLLRAAAAQLDVRQPIVVGHSFGGSVAMAWGVQAPDDTAGLVLLGGVSMPWPGGLSASYHVNGSGLGGATVVPMITAFAPQARIEAVLARVFAPQPVPAGYAAHFGLGLAIRRDTLRANARQVLALRPHVVEMSQAYPGLDLPVHLVHGDADTTVPLEIHSGPLSQLLPDARLTVLPGAGHMPHHADQAATIAAIDDVARRAGLR
jgi:pimeloyl-ACP methyl ester carboxylesterase